MEFLFIVGIIIAVVGAVTIAAVMRQNDAPSAGEPASDVLQSPAAESPAAQLPVDQPDAVAKAMAAMAEVKPAAMTDDDTLTIETITALYAHANDDVAVESSLKINVPNLLAAQIEGLYAEYVQLDEERTRLAEALLANMLFEKIERSAGRLEIATERETLDLRERFSKVSADYNRVQFRLGSLQYLNTRLYDPHVAQQLEELVLEVKRLADRTR
jgi:hypothetical protein